MVIKLIGAGLIIVGCGSFGFLVANGIKKECITLRQFIIAVEFMLCEINYRMTPLPELFRLTSSVCSGSMCKFFLNAANELDKHTSIVPQTCILNALKISKDLPKYTTECILLLSQTIGTFNLSGQLKVLEHVKAEATRKLQQASDNQENKLKYYKTLGLSAGTALVIIFV